MIIEMKIKMIIKIDHLINKPRRRHEHKYTKYTSLRFE